MSSSAKKRPGRPANPVFDAKGRSIAGLAATVYAKGKDGAPLYRYYVQGTSPPVWLGTDLPMAVVRLRELEAQSKTIPLTTSRARKATASEAEAIRKAFLSEARARGLTRASDDDFGPIQPTPKIRPTLQLPEADFWQLVRSKILADPKVAAART